MKNECIECHEDFKMKGGWKEVCPPCRLILIERKKQEALQQKEHRRHGYYLIFERDNFCCIYCGRSPIEDNIKLVVDHIVPKSKKGNHSIYNLISCCWECNAGKNTIPLKGDVYRRIVEVIKERNKGISPEAAALVESIFKQLH